MPHRSNGTRTGGKAGASRSVLLELALDAADAGAYRIDYRTGRLWSDERHDALFGISRERSDQTYRPFLDLIHSEDRERVMSSADEAARLGIPLEIEFRIVRCDGTVRWIESRSRVGSDGSGAHSYRHGVVYDITERKLAEEKLRNTLKELERAAQAKSDLLASVSHEMRTPMHAVLGMTDILLDSELDEEQRDLAQRVRRAGANLLATLNDVLDLSKAEAGKIELCPGLVPLRPWLDEILSLFAHQAEAIGLDLRCHVAPGVPTAIEADATRLRQILVNLIGNALKFTRQGHVILRVAARREPRATVRLEFVVEDTGAGIDPADLARLFEPYAQIDRGSREISGTGLGLAIARRLAEQMGGEIRVKSRLGVGSTFRLSVPLQPSDAAAAAKRLQRRPPATIASPALPLDGAAPTPHHAAQLAQPRT